MTTKNNRKQSKFAKPSNGSGRLKRERQSTAKAPWGNTDAKFRAFLQIMRDIISKPKLGEQYVESEKAAKQAFRDKGMDVPNDVRVIFVRAGDSAKLAASSAIIELPGQDVTAAASDDALSELWLGLYHINW